MIQAFQVNYKKYKLEYEEEQKAKIDYMRGWKNTIDWLKWYIKHDKVNSAIKGRICDTSYIASAIDNYSFYIAKINDNTFRIIDNMEG